MRRKKPIYPSGTPGETGKTGEQQVSPVLPVVRDPYIGEKKV
jgi:hypothetical protein